MGDSEEQKIEEKVKAINLNANAAAASSSEYSEEEDKRSDEFKAAGNESFKSKLVVSSQCEAFIGTVIVWYPLCIYCRHGE